VTKVTAEGEQEKNTSQTFLTVGKKLVNQVTSESFHEQIQEIGLHQVQRRTANQQLTLERRPARLACIFQLYEGIKREPPTCNKFLVVHNFARPDRASVAIENIIQKCAQ
jgi:hypothetical protein